MSTFWLVIDLLCAVPLLMILLMALHWTLIQRERRRIARFIRVVDKAIQYDYRLPTETRAVVGTTMASIATVVERGLHDQ